MKKIKKTSLLLLSLFFLSCSIPEDSIDSIIETPTVFQISNCFLMLAPDSSPMLGFTIKGNNIKHINEYSIFFEFYNSSTLIKNINNNSDNFIFNEFDLNISEIKDYALTFYGWYGVNKIRLKIYNYQFENEEIKECNSLIQRCEEQFVCLNPKNCELFDWEKYAEK